MFFTLALLPDGQLTMRPLPEADTTEAMPDAPWLTELATAFETSSGEGLLRLGVLTPPSHWPPVFAFWHHLAASLLAELSRDPDVEAHRGATPLAFPDVERMCAEAPPMAGGEYLNPEVLAALRQATQAAFTKALATHAGTVADWFRAQNSQWHVVGRVCFHLAENKSGAAEPFAFLATYAAGIAASGKTRHQPLGTAVERAALETDHDFLVRLLEPVRNAAQESPFLRSLVESKALFRPQAWSPAQAHAFLREVPAYEAAGIAVRVPKWWHPQLRRARVQARVGEKSEGTLGWNALLSFSVNVTIEGEELTPEEIESLLKSVDGLAFVRGKWVDVSGDELRATLEKWKEFEKAAAENGVTFLEAMRLLSGAGPAKEGLAASEERLHKWSDVVAGRDLAALLAELRNPASVQLPPQDLDATLRPYQEKGAAWLSFVTSLGLGACLADDMGLGKTIQVISYFLLCRKTTPRHPHLVVAPASLLGNWKHEIERFAPTLRAKVLHGSEAFEGQLEECDVVITTYGTVLRNPQLRGYRWESVVVDEAQALKNPDAKQTRAVKELRAQARVALTGTPVENRLGDLWSLFDFLNPGLLGPRSEFEKFTRSIQKGNGTGFALLRKLTAPYILRRMKTDRSIIADLPDKTEIRAECGLSAKQVALYRDTVRELEEKLAKSEGMARKGLVLSALMRFKQICNHPSHWLGDGEWNPEESGKFLRLREICEEIAARGEKVLVFTQFQEMVPVLSDHLERIFGAPGLTLHGGTPVKKRQERVAAFADARRFPHFVLSLKAGGTGLNLTAANHVVHFDRWWNPAVENQATDRAFRIGQHRNVLVHKFVTVGTLEEKIDDLIESKKALAREVLAEGGSEMSLTELDDAALLRLVSLDLGAAMQE